MSENSNEHDGPQVDKWLAKMREQFAASDEPLPKELANRHPFVWIDGPLDMIAARVVEILRGKNLIFRRGLEVGTVDEAGEWTEMTTDRFRSWLPMTGGVIPYKGLKDNKPVKVSVPYEVARGVLASDELRTKLPEIRQINMVRMPVFREELDDRDDKKRMGFRKIELLPLGYDSEAKTFTVFQTADFDEDMDSNDGFTWLKDLLKYFPFADEDRRAVQIAAMLTVYAGNLFNGRSPMFLWNSNLAGSGKSRLSQLALDPVFGESGASGYSYDSREEVRKELDAKAQEFAQYVWFDDVPKGTIRDVVLNRWLTRLTWQCRVLGTKGMFKGKLFAVTFMTGAQIELDGMLARRTLVVDLFPRQRARNRTLPKDAIAINDDFFGNDEMRSKVLGSMWSLIRWWDESGRPGLKECPALEGEKELDSFESWSSIIPTIVATVNFGNCLKEFEAPDSGDTETREFEQLVRLLIEQYAVGRDSGEVTMENVIACARQNGLFIDTLGSLDDVIRDLGRQKNWEWDIPRELEDITDEGHREKLTRRFKGEKAAGWTDKRIQSMWGKKFRKSAVSGQHFEVADEVWEFGTRETSRKSMFPIRKVAGVVNFDDEPEKK
ncbi:MAG: hypothetical protein QM496_13835 [Verrucomicrobiota bacterium]